MMAHRISLGPSMAQQAAANERNVARYRKAQGKWPWRDFLTEEEHATLKKADEAKAVWLKLNATRASIQNRAIQRAKHAASTNITTAKDAT